MAVIYEIKERRVVPNWRDFKRTLQIGELVSSNLYHYDIDINISRAVYDWQRNQNIGTAADLVSAAFISGGKEETKEVIQAITYILSHKDLASHSLIQIAELLTKLRSNNNKSNISTKILEKDVDTIQEFQAFIDNKVLNRVIHKTKKIALSQPRNPIIWVDLARLYLMNGLENKANNAIITALQLAPNNRFVLRSATRFFVHTNQHEKALHFLRKSDFIKQDPWLLSAHIATSSIIGRFSPMIKVGLKTLNNDKYSPFDYTELASALGTLEFKDGSFKKSKELFHKSLISPNDNSLAQFEWIAKKDPRFDFNPFSFNKVINPFEAFALDFYEKGQWDKAFNNSIKWFLDVPFSKRPILLGSFIAGSLLEDKQSSILLLKVGLQANPNDPTLLNNIIYDLATSNNLEETIYYIYQLKNIDFTNLPNETKITIQATIGLVSIRFGDFEKGIQLYENAIKNAEKIQNDYLKKLAIINYTRELIIANLPKKDKYLKMVKEMMIDNKHKDLEKLKNDVIKLANDNTQPNNAYSPRRYVKIKTKDHNTFNKLFRFLKKED